MKALDKVKECIKNKNNFVLQGGAGSGKTEGLKHTLEYINETMPNTRVACFTHTNNAVNEIKERVGSNFEISTLHSFISDLIKYYNKDIKKVLPEIFILDKIECIETLDHKDYKDKYEKHAKLIFRQFGTKSEKVIGSTEYKKDYVNNNIALNEMINKTNKKIVDIIHEADYKKIEYNKSKFDSFMRLTYGHDSLIDIFSLLIKRNRKLAKIISDKYDYIFIDEYQDTAKSIIDALIINVSLEFELTVGFFGDSMQSIYSEGIGDLEYYSNNYGLIEIPKEDNYRCSDKIIKLINRFRSDDLEQEVALKLKPNGKCESKDDRKGEVKLFYFQCDKKSVNNHVEKILDVVSTQFTDAKILMLTNKSIASKLGFEQLYSIFDTAYSEAIEEIENYLERAQYDVLLKMCELYRTKSYNELFVLLKSNKCIIKNAISKKHINEFFENITSKELKASSVLKEAIGLGMIKQNDISKFLDFNMKQDIGAFYEDNEYRSFAKSYESGATTHTSMKKSGFGFTKEEFDHIKSKYLIIKLKEILTTDFVSFGELLNFHSYLIGDEKFITMHKTKGSGIKNVIVVLHNFNWTKYNFEYLFSDGNSESVTSRTNKLFYVSCSRAIENLYLIMPITNNKDEVLKYFPVNEELFFTGEV